MSDEHRPSMREALRASAPVPPGSPLIVPWFLTVGAGLLVLILSVGYFLFFSFRGPPEAPKDNRLRIIYEQTKGESSVHDGMILLTGKAELYEQKELLAYLTALRPLIVDSEMVWLPGDFKMDSIDWTDTAHAQTALLADGKKRVQIPPDALAELKRRGDRVVELGASPNPANPPHPDKPKGLP